MKSLKPGKIRITRQQARHYLLEYHHLTPRTQLSGKEGILDYVAQVGCLQFDPLNIVGHNQELTLQSRIRDFKPSLLNDLLYTDRTLLDGWDKNMAIYLTSDWPLFHRRRQGCLEYYSQRDKEVMDILPEIREIIRQKGPVCSRDLDFNQVVGWSWSPTRLARAALDSMFFWGELIVHHRVHTRKYYDFTENHLAKELLKQAPANREDVDYYKWYVLRRIGGVGLLWARASDAWLGIYDMKSEHRKAAIEELLASGELVQAELEDCNYPIYLRAKDLSYFELDDSSGDQNEPKISILAPLDNMLWDRKFIKELFGFEYVWEVYKPVKDRQYGYYVLPVLYGDRFVARFEPGRDSKSNIMEIKNWWWEPEVKVTAKMKQAIKDCFARFIDAMGFEGLAINETSGANSHGFKL